MELRGEPLMYLHRTYVSLSSIGLTITSGIQIRISLINAKISACRRDGKLVVYTFYQNYDLLLTKLSLAQGHNYGAPRKERI